MVQPLSFPTQTGHSRVSFHDGFDDPRAGGRHCGIDIGSTEGTTIFSATTGTVIQEHLLGGGRTVPGRRRQRLPWRGVDSSPRSGNFAIIVDHYGFFYFYAHMRTVSVEPGQIVFAGQAIGTMGNTGLGGGHGPIHLHFQVWSPFSHGRSRNEYRSLRFERRFGTPVNPFIELKEAAIQIPGAVSGRGNVGPRRNVEGIIIDPPTPGQLRQRREQQDERLDELMSNACQSGSFVHN